MTIAFELEEAKNMWDDCIVQAHITHMLNSKYIILKDSTNCQMVA